MRKIKICVSEGKHGLIKECRVLASRIRSHDGLDCDVLHSKAGFKNLLRTVYDSLKGPNYSVVVIYNISATSLLLAVTSRLQRRAVLWMNHEPHGFKHKLQNNSVWYAIQVSIVEKIMSQITSLVGTPNQKNARKDKIEYLPLQYKLNEAFSNHAYIKSEKSVGFMGRLDKTRFLNGFKALTQNGLEITFFPNGIDKSEDAKQLFLAQVSHVINIFERKHAQSGVTPDALSYYVPLIVCRTDCWSELDWGGYLTCIEHKRLEAETREEIYSIVTGDTALDRTKFEQTFDQQFGRASFDAYWLPVIQKLLKRSVK